MNDHRTLLFADANYVFVSCHFGALLNTSGVSAKLLKLDKMSSRKLQQFLLCLGVMMIIVICENLNEKEKYKKGVRNYFRILY